jgi:hypothetical protein
MEGANSQNNSDTHCLVQDHERPLSNEILLSVMAIGPVATGKSRNAQHFEGLQIVSKCLFSLDDLLKQNSRNSRNKSIFFAKHVYKLIVQLWARNLTNCQTAIGQKTFSGAYPQKFLAHHSRCWTSANMPWTLSESW